MVRRGTCESACPMKERKGPNEEGEKVRLMLVRESMQAVAASGIFVLIAACSTDRSGLEKDLPCNLMVRQSLFPAFCNPCETYCPCSSHTCAYRCADGHWPCPPRALEYRTTQRTRCNAVRYIMLATIVSYCAVDSIVHDRDYSRAISEEGTPSCNSVQNAVQP